jgi:hypothetical protein
MEDQNVSPDKSIPKELVEDNDQQGTEEQKQSLYSKIRGMTVSEKIKLATVGNREARNLLIKDVNKVVINAVINNPRLTEDDAIGYAKNLNLSDEVVKLISQKKELFKNYQIKLALVSNPKNPIATSLKLLNHLREKDLRYISRTKNVPTIISTAAMKLLAKRGRV